MKFVDEFRDAGTARALATRIAALCEPGRRYKFMEVCGGHTHTIYKHGLEDYLPETVSLVHGPGCPVCVIPMGRVDDAIAIAERDDVILTTFGDMLRVPGGRGSFFDSKAAGADIRMVYSPLDALKVARKNPDKRVVFMAIGFETTAPSTAMTVLRAAAEGLDNFSIFCNHVTIIPAIKAILDSPGMQLDGFIGPGHVSTIIGLAPFEFVPTYRPAIGIERFVCGTPPILAMRALECGLEVFGEAEALGGMPALRDKSIALTSLFIERVEASCAGLGLTLASPRAPAERGSQVSFAHAEGYPVMQALIELGVVGDFRAGQEGGDVHLRRVGST